MLEKIDRLESLVEQMPHQLENSHDAYQLEAIVANIKETLLEIVCTDSHQFSNSLQSILHHLCQDYYLDPGFANCMLGLLDASELLKNRQSASNYNVNALLRDVKYLFQQLIEKMRERYPQNR